MQGDSKIADEIEKGNIDGVPEGWDLALLTSDDGSMLQIHAGHIAPTPIPGTLLPLQDGEDPGVLTDSSATTGLIMLVVTAASTDVIQTMDPIGNESLLHPAFNRTHVTCPFPHPENRPPDCYSYDSRVYAEYQSENTPQLSISIDYVGANTWWSGGWTGNQFRDHVFLEISGEQDGWIPAAGFLVSGEGRYAPL